VMLSGEVRLPAATVAITKLRPPPPSVGAVERTDLLTRIAGPGNPLTLIVAPAGWGKSTLLAQWCAAASASSGRRVAFGALDALDDDPVRFWTIVQASLAGPSDSVATSVPTSPRAGDPGLWAAVVPQLVNELAGATEPVVLVIDDYHHVTDETIHTGVRYLIEHIPPTTRVVIASRHEPPLGLARQRAAARLAEIRAVDLALGVGDVANVVHEVSGVELERADAVLLHNRTEGWPAGVHLAALSLRGNADPGVYIRDFAGDHRHVVDFLTSEVLTRIPEDVRVFMMRCSILDRLEADLCRAVTGYDDAADQLRGAERRGLFLVPLDEQRRWYRLHRLFADWMRHQLETEPDEDVARLHGRAATWYRDHEMPIEAADHALAAGDWDTARHLIVAHGETLTAEGRLATLTRLLTRIPDDIVASDPVLAIAAASTAATAGDLDRAERLVAFAEDAVAAGAPVAVPIAADVEIGAVQATIRLMRRDLEGAALVAQQAARLERDPSRQRYGIAHVISATALLWLGRCGEAQVVVDEVWADVETVFVRLAAAGVLAAACFEVGDLERAERIGRYAVETTIERHVGPSPETCLAHLALGGVYTQRSELTEAGRHLARGIELANLWRVPPQAAYGHLLQARLRVAQGRYDEARRLIHAAAPIVEAARNAGLLAKTLHRVEQSLRTAQQGSASTPGGDLTERELDVLRLLPSHLTRREIANRLDLSLNTIKSYTLNVYTKLGVSSRADAVARARSLELL
jgi:LuxR family maltose regulon positive regulatory protein